MSAARRRRLSPPAGTPGSRALAAPSSHRGGTLHVVFANDVFTTGYDPFDPAVAPYGQHWQMLAMTNDGLLTYRKTGGPAGLEVVPDLAVSMPAISDGGRTYTFQLRKGIRYSNGAPVRASDFRFSVERQLQPDALTPAIARLLPGHLLREPARLRRVPARSAAVFARQGDRGRQQHRDDHDPPVACRPRPAAEARHHRSATSSRPVRRPPTAGEPVPATGPYMIAKAVEDADQRAAGPEPALPSMVGGRPAGRLSRPDSLDE